MNYERSLRMSNISIGIGLISIAISLAVIFFR